MMLSRWFKALIVIALLSTPVLAEEQIADFSDQSVPVLNDELKKIWMELRRITSGAGTLDHSALSNLSYASAGHTGFQPAGAYLTSVTADSPLSGAGTAGSHLTIDLSGYLQLDQTSPQTVINGSPKFDAGITLTTNASNGITFEGSPQSNILWDSGSGFIRVHSALTCGGASYNLGDPATYVWNYVYGNYFVTTGGTSSDFVKGDGSLDSTTYLSSESDPLSLHIDQSTPQTVDNGRPTFNQAIISIGETRLRQSVAGDVLALYAGDDTQRLFHIDSNGDTWFDYGNILDASGYALIDPQSRQLFASDGSSLMMDWSSNALLGLYASGAQQIQITDGAILPTTDNDVDFGNTSYHFKHAYFGAVDIGAGLTYGSGEDGGGIFCNRNAGYIYTLINSGDTATTYSTVDYQIVSDAGLYLQNYDSGSTGDIYAFRYLTKADGADGNYVRIRRHTTSDDTGGELDLYVDQYGTAHITSTKVGNWSGDIQIYPGSDCGMVIGAYTAGYLGKTFKILEYGGTNVSLLENTGANESLAIGGYLTATSSTKHFYLNLDDTTDMVKLAREDTNVLGFLVDMPLALVDVNTKFVNNSGDIDVYTTSNKTIELQTPVYEDVRVSSGNIDRPGGSDPAWVSVAPGGSGTTTYLLEFAKNNYGTFTVQIPHAYKTGEDIKVHIHWTPGNRGNEENGATVGWKIDYTWANINSNFGTMSTADLSDACDGTDWKHQMTPDVTIDGHTVAKGISSMLICNVKRTDTGTDDTWAGTASGELPLLLEVDFHFPIDTMGSRDWGTK